MNFVVERSRGEFINFLHDDDLFAPNKISRMIDLFLNSEVGDRIAFVSSSQRIIDNDGNLLRIRMPMNFDEDLIVITGESFGRECLKGCGNFGGELTTNLIRRDELLDLESGKYFVGNCR